MLCVDFNIGCVNEFVNFDKFDWIMFLKFYLGVNEKKAKLNLNVEFNN